MQFGSCLVIGLLRCHVHQNLPNLIIILRTCRLVKGSGEIIEEIVSKEEQKRINKVRNTASAIFINFDLAGDSVIEV